MNISIRREVAIISVIASSMRELSGILVSIADSLQSAGARLIAVGDSHNSVQCLIDGRFLEAAVKELTDTFALDTSDPEKIGASQ